MKAAGAARQHSIVLELFVSLSGRNGLALRSTVFHHGLLVSCLSLRLAPGFSSLAMHFFCPRVARCEETQAVEEPETVH